SSYSLREVSDVSTSLDMTRMQSERLDDVRINRAVSHAGVQSLAALYLRNGTNKIALRVDRHGVATPQCRLRPEHSENFLRALEALSHCVNQLGRTCRQPPRELGKSAAPQNNLARRIVSPQCSRIFR